MYTHRSPPKSSNTNQSAGGSSHSNILSSSTTTGGSKLSLYSNSSSSGLLNSGSSELNKNHHHHHHHSHYQYHSGGSDSGGGAGSGGGRGSLSGSAMKRGKKQHWGVKSTRDRAGMSFLIVIVFFAVFGLIILTELFMIDERSHGGMVVLRHGSNLGGRIGDSLPDYDGPKDDYDLMDSNLMIDNKLGFVQFRDNKLKIQDADNNEVGRLAGILLKTGANGAAGGGSVGGVSAVNTPLMPWGKVLPTNVEETLPRYPIGTQPTDGTWQVVNGTRFKFFVFSAYYDRRDGAELVRVIGATKTRGPERVYCRFWYVNRNASSGVGQQQRGRFTSATVMARVRIIRENWNLKYSACFVLCPVRGAPELGVPQFVSIVSRLRAPPGNLLTLRNTDWDPDFATNRSTGGTGGSASAAHNSSSSSSSTSSSSTSSASSTPLGDSPPPRGEHIPDKIAICVKPFHFNYDQALYLMEYLEFYALLGVSHFTFYNHTIGPHASCVLRHYMNGDVPGNSSAWDAMDLTSTLEQAAHGSTNNSKSQFTAKHRESANYIKPTVNILPWNLNMRSQKEIRTEGLFAALNDCLYRTMYRYKYLALVDLDEFIVPRHNDTLNELINALNRGYRNRNTGAYSFQNAFFYLQFPDDPSVMWRNSLNTRLRAALVTQRKTRRRFKLHPQKQRSKYICKPESVVEAGNHFVWEFSPGKGSLNVPPTDAILQHYRVCEFGGNDCIKAPSVIDRTATKYASRLVQRVDAVYKYLKERCDLPELPVLPDPPQTEPINSKTSNDINNNNNNKETKKSNEVITKKSQTETNETKSNHINSNNNDTTNTKTTRTISTKVPPTTPVADSAAKLSHLSKKRKMIVFEEGEDGLPMAKVQYLK